ncbi:hypothetical protein T09_12108 [Trichinella sp. T9]|nr:hypothetical protein T09_12108 [Trichinella sp. T9]
MPRIVGLLQTHLMLQQLNNSYSFVNILKSVLHSVDDEYLSVRYYQNVPFPSSYSACGHGIMWRITSTSSMVNHVVVNVTRVCSEDHLVSKERTFFKVKHSMELGFLKTTRSCCHNEIYNLSIVSNSSGVRNLDASMMMAGNGGLQVSMRIAGNGGLHVSMVMAGMMMAGMMMAGMMMVSMMMAGNGGLQVSMVMAGKYEDPRSANFKTP